MHTPSTLFMMVDYLEFPKVTLDERKVVEFHVRDLNLKKDALASVYPESVAIAVPAEEASAMRSDQPWRNVVVRVSVLGEDGATVQESVVDFAEWKGGANAGSHGASVTAPLRDYGKGRPGLNYTVRVEVVRPSARKSDRLRVCTI